MSDETKYYAIQINGEDGALLARIKTNGEIEYGPNYSPDEAARVFWQAMAHHIPPSFRPEGREQWRNEIIEECAEIAGQMDGFYDWEIATAILALKRPAPQDKP